MPPRNYPNAGLLAMAEQIKSKPDGEFLSSLLKRMYSGEKDVGYQLYLRNPKTLSSGESVLGKRGEPKLTVPLTDVDAVYYFMTTTLQISSEAAKGPEAAPAPSMKVVKAKQVTARVYFKNPAGFESLIKDLLRRLNLTPSEAKKVHASLLPTVFMSTNIRICLDDKGEVIGITGMDRNGIQGHRLSIMTEVAKTETTPTASDDF